METFGPAISSRRQLFLSSAVGALLGAAWGTTFLEAEMRSQHPVITIYRTPQLFSMVIECASARILLLDANDADAVSEAVQTTMGFLRQRLDIMIASAPALQALSAEFMQRWNVATIYATPDSKRPLAEPLYGHAIIIGDLRITGDSIASGRWRTTAQPELLPWYLDIRYRGVRCIYGSLQVVMQAIASTPEPATTMAITNDAGSEALFGGTVDIIALPAESIEFSSRSMPPETSAKIVRLYRDTATSIRFAPNSFILPDDLQIE